MSNGIRIDTLYTEDGKYEAVLTMFLGDTDKAWVEYNKEQLQHLIDLLIEQSALMDDSE